MCGYYCILGVHHLKKMMEHGKELMTVKLSIINQQELWMIVMDLDHKLVTLEGKINNLREIFLNAINFNLLTSL